MARPPADIEGKLARLSNAAREGHPDLAAQIRLSDDAAPPAEGADLDTLRQMAADAGAAACGEQVAALYQRLDLSDLEQKNPEWMPGFTPLPLSYALQARRMLLDAGVWHEDWLPVLQGAGPDFYAVNLGQASCPVGFIDIESGDTGLRSDFASLGAWLDHLETAFASGLYAAHDHGILRRNPSRSEAAGGTPVSPQIQNWLEEMQSPDGPTMGEAASRLIAARDPAATPGLIELLSHPRWRTRSMAIQVLAQVGDHTAAEPVASLLQDPHPEVRMSAAQYLPDLEPDDLEKRYLEALDAATELMMKRVVISVLGYHGGADSAVRLNEIKEPMLQEDVRIALMQIEGRIGER